MQALSDSLGLNQTWATTQLCKPARLWRQPRDKQCWHGIGQGPPKTAAGGWWWATPDHARRRGALARLGREPDDAAWTRRR